MTCLYGGPAITFPRSKHTGGAQPLKLQFKHNGNFTAKIIAAFALVLTDKQEVSPQMVNDSLISNNLLFIITPSGFL